MSARKRVVTFGELLLRLKSPGMERLFQSPMLEATFGGAESNVAASLALFGHHAVHVTIVPPNALGDAAVTELRRLGVDTSRIQRRGDRLGVYYLEAGANQRPGRVIYDRADSAMAQVQPGDVDWAEVLRGADWFHLSGVTPAISASAADVALEAMRVARQLGVTVSCDYNYRSTLWRYGREARTVMRQLWREVDVGFASAAEGEQLLGRAHDDAALDLELSGDRLRALGEQMLDAFPNLRMQLFSVRDGASADRNGLRACLADRGRFVQSRHYEIADIVDRVGAGDALAAGVIHGLLATGDAAYALEFGVAAGCLKHSIPGDVNRVSLAEVELLLAGNGGGHVHR